MIEWLTICHRQGWCSTQQRMHALARGRGYCKRNLKQREALGLSSCPSEAMLAHQAAALAYHEASSRGSKQSIATLVAAKDTTPPAD